MTTFLICEPVWTASQHISQLGTHCDILVLPPRNSTSAKPKATPWSRGCVVSCQGHPGSRRGCGRGNGKRFNPLVQGGEDSIYYCLRTDDGSHRNVSLARVVVSSFLEVPWEHQGCRCASNLRIPVWTCELPILTQNFRNNSPTVVVSFASQCADLIVPRHGTEDGY